MLLISVNIKEKLTAEKIDSCNQGLEPKQKNPIPELEPLKCIELESKLGLYCDRK